MFSSGLLTDFVNRCCVHVGIPICLLRYLPDFMYFVDVNILGSETCTPHLLTQSVRRPEDDRLKGRNM